MEADVGSNHVCDQKSPLLTIFAVNKTTHTAGDAKINGEGIKTKKLKPPSFTSKPGF